MDKRGRRDIDVPQSPKIQGKAGITNSTDPCNDVQDEIRKRRAGNDAKRPAKRMRTDDSNPIDHGERIHSGKRKANTDTTQPEKRARCSISNTNASSVLEDPSVEAMDAGDTPEKRCRCSDSTSSSDSVITVSSSPWVILEATDETSDDSGCDVRQDFTSVSTEEIIYEMSSKGNTSRADFEKKYKQLGLIGAGGFGSVYQGILKSDLIPVAIKHITKDAVLWQQVSCNGNTYKVILEVALMLKAAGLPGSAEKSAAVALLEWYLLDQELILVMDRPLPCVDLHSYLNSHGGSLSELEAKMILKQLVDAAVDLQSKGVFHRDIKSKNVLIQMGPGAPKVRLIDFGCGTFLTETPCSTFCGTLVFLPPEYLDEDKYSAGPTTVWQLGILFFLLLSGHEYFSTKRYIEGRIHVNSALSTDVKTLLLMCLARNPMERATLEELQLFPTLRHLCPSPIEGRSH